MSLCVGLWWCHGDLTASSEETKLITKFFISYMLHPFDMEWRGSVEFSGPQSDVLRHVKLTIVNRGNCSSSQLCSFATRKDTCQSDSGSTFPLCAREKRLTISFSTFLNECNQAAHCTSWVMAHYIMSASWALALPADRTSHLSIPVSVHIWYGVICLHKFMAALLLSPARAPLSFNM